MLMIEAEISKQRLDHYLNLTTTAREKVNVMQHLSVQQQHDVQVLLEMADAYIADAHYFSKQGDYIRSFGAINYAHAWIDAGVKLRLLDGQGDDVLFTLP
jgi:hypothetical protein